MFSLYSYAPTQYDQADTLVEKNIEFKYEGPFIGAIHGWEISAHRLFTGTISAKIGLAYLNSKYVEDSNFNMFYHYDQTSTNWTEKDIYKGDSWGLTFGVGWRGITPIQNLSYSLDIGGYRYSFDSDGVNTLGTITENVVSYQAGISYAF